MNEDDPKSPKVTIEMSAYDGHQLLKELEHSCRVMNRDVSEAKRLWELVASQMAGTPAVLDVHR